MWLLPLPPRVSVSRVHVCVVYALVCTHAHMSVGTSMCVGVRVHVGVQPEVAVRRLLRSLSTLCIGIGKLKRTQKFWLIKPASSLPASLCHHPPHSGMTGGLPHHRRLGTLGL